MRHSLIVLHLHNRISIFDFQLQYIFIFICKPERHKRKYQRIERCLKHNHKSTFHYTSDTNFVTFTDKFATSVHHIQQKPPRKQSNSSSDHTRDSSHSHSDACEIRVLTTYIHTVPISGSGTLLCFWITSITN